MSKMVEVIPNYIIRNKRSSCAVSLVLIFITGFAVSFPKLLFLFFLLAGLRAYAFLVIFSFRNLSVGASLFYITFKNGLLFYYGVNLDLNIFFNK